MEFCAGQILKTLLLEADTNKKVKTSQNTPCTNRVSRLAICSASAALKRSSLFTR